MNPLELLPLAAMRRNHALEHATVHILTERHPELRLVASSNPTGFTVYGPVETEVLAQAVSEGLQRLQAGERQLAIHPRCGTNLAAGVALAGLASSAALSGRRRSPLEKALQLALGLAAALAVARPLGARLQKRITTSSDVGGLRVRKILRLQRGTVVVHRVETEQG